MKGTIQYKNEKWSFDINDLTKGDSLLNLCHEKTHLSKDRIRIFYFDSQKGKVTVNESTKINDIPVTEFYVKDLGPQIGYRTVFILEYLGPFLLFPLVLYIMHTDILGNSYAKIALSLWEFHYAKRIFESIFVHTFSHPTMPLRNLFKNCTYYWGAALLISRSISLASKTVNEINMRRKFGILIFCISEMLNLYCHLKLKYLRPKGSKKHYLPKGFLFNYIICPNYTTEICTWIGFLLYSGVLTALLFLIAGALQMSAWAKQKKNRLVKEFPEAKRRALLIPFLL